LEELPSSLLSYLSDSDREPVLDWWRGLSAIDQRTLVAAYDERWERCFFGPVPDDDTLPVVHGSRFLPDDDAWQFYEWESDWREYLVEHPDVSLMSGMFGSGLWHLPGGRLKISVDWSRTRFQNWELPPSAQLAE